MSSAINGAVPPGKLLVERGLFLLDNERSLLQQYKIGAIASKNSDGDVTYAKMIAAGELAIPVVMIQRPLILAETPLEIQRMTDCGSEMGDCN